MSFNNCTYCRYAEWKKTKVGRLHPGGDGRCTWQIVHPRLPLARQWEYPYSSEKPPGIRIGFLDRHKPFEKCPTFQPIETAKA